MKEYEVASLFAGVGGIDLGFKNAGFKTVYANEYDEYAIETFKLNFPNVTHIDERDIHDVKVNELPDFDILIAGFPCQAFSIAGYQQGFDDKKGRGELFFEIIRIMKKKRPRVALFENVKNLVSHDNGNTFKVIREELEHLQYKYVYQVLNGCEYGNIPQNRERIYIIAFRDDEDFKNFTLPMSIPLTKTIEDVIEFDKIQDKKYYYTQESCKFYNQLKENMKNHESIYQWRRIYVRENKSKLVPTLTANMGTGGHNVPLILTSDNKIRKLTPRECFNVQGFPSTFKLPVQSNSRLYKQAGNSVVVPVIERIAKEIMKALKKTDEGKNTYSENKYAKLILKLYEDNMFDEIIETARDSQFRKQMYKKYEM